MGMQRGRVALMVWRGWERVSFESGCGGKFVNWKWQCVGRIQWGGLALLARIDDRTACDTAWRLRSTAQVHDDLNGSHPPSVSLSRPCPSFIRAPSVPESKTKSTVSIVFSVTNSVCLAQYYNINPFFSLISFLLIYFEILGWGTYIIGLISLLVITFPSHAYIMGFDITVNHQRIQTTRSHVSRCHHCN